MLPMTGLSVTTQYKFASCVHILCLTSSFCFKVEHTHNTQRVQNISICWLSITQRALLTHISHPCSDRSPEKNNNNNNNKKTGRNRQEKRAAFRVKYKRERLSASMEKSQHAELQRK